MSVAKHKDNGWSKFIRLCMQNKTEQQYKEYLELFLTFEEREAIAGRYLIVRELLDGKLTQREIADKCNLSIAKITRGSNSLKTISEKLRIFLQKNIK